MSEGQLKKLVANCETPPPATPAPAPAATSPAVVANTQKPMTDAEWFAAAPPSVRAILTANMEAANKAKEQVADRIIANQTAAGVPAEFIYKKEFLVLQAPELLNGLDATATAAARPVVANAFGGNHQQVPMYAGQQGGAANYGYGAFAANLGEDDEVLERASSFPITKGA